MLPPSLHLTFSSFEETRRVLPSFLVSSLRSLHKHSTQTVPGFPDFFFLVDSEIVPTLKRICWSTVDL